MLTGSNDMKIHTSISFPCLQEMDPTIHPRLEP